MQADIESRIRELLVSRLNVSAATLAGGDGDTPLLGRGIGLDSVEAMALASEIETEFDIRFEDAELTAELFHTIGVLAAAVESKLQEIK